MNSKDRKFSAVDVNAALASDVPFPSSVAAVKLRSLNSTQLCQLFDHCYLYNLGNFVHRNKLTGIHLQDGVENVQDLLDLGLNKLTAKALFKRITVWKEEGLPGDFHPALVEQTTHIPISRSANVSDDAIASVVDTKEAAPITPPMINFPCITTLADKELDDDYVAAAYCRDRAATDRIVAAAENDNHLAEAYLSNLYDREDTLVGHDRAKAEVYAVQAMPWLIECADGGNMFAQFSLATCYTRGRAVAKSREEALKYYKLSADQGHATSQNDLGVSYEDGTGVAKDDTQAVRYYQLAANQGHAMAQCNLGVCYAHGTGVSKDDTQAVCYFQRAAKQGHAQAQCKLGVRYANGTGVAKDIVEAVRLYQLSAVKGNAQAKCNLGVCYEHGTGVAKDETEAVRLYKLSAAQGFTILCFPTVVYRALLTYWDYNRSNEKRSEKNKLNPEHQRNAKKNKREEFDQFDLLSRASESIKEGRVSSASSSTNQPVVIQNVKCKVFTFDHSSIKRPATYPNPDTNRPVQKKQGSISSFVKRCGAESKSGESDGQTIDEYMQ